MFLMKILQVRMPFMNRRNAERSFIKGEAIPINLKEKLVSLFHKHICLPNISFDYNKRMILVPSTSKKILIKFNLQFIY